MTGQASHWISQLQFTNQSEHQDPYRIHQLVSMAFPETPGGHDPQHRARHQILWANEQTRPDRITITVQSSTRPDWTALHADRVVEPANALELPVRLPGISKGTQLRFHLNASPQRSLSRPRTDGFKPRGTRQPILDPEGRIAWLVKTADTNGFEVDPAAIHTEDQTPVRSALKPKLGWQVALFRGILTVSDPDTFHEARLSGFGPGKAVGLGLLRIAR